MNVPTRAMAEERYPAAAIDKALETLELAYSYLREKPVVEIELRDAMQRLYRAKELHEVSNQARRPGAGQ